MAMSFVSSFYLFFIFLFFCISIEIQFIACSFFFFQFHTEPLKELLESDDKFGFIVMDGSGCLFGTLSGNTREVLYRLMVDLPKKHGRGGQSALRFARLRLEKRHNYVRKAGFLSFFFFFAFPYDCVLCKFVSVSACCVYKNSFALSAEQ
jgi:hypothetical protein